MDRILRAAAIGLAIASTAAAGATDDPLPDKITFKAAYFDDNSNPIKSGSLPKVVLLRVPVIAGSMSGELNLPYVIQVEVVTGEPTTIDLGGVSTTVDRLAGPVTRDAAARGLVVTPGEARFARFAPLAAHPDTGKSVGGAKFQGVTRDQTLVIVYFDRPCSMTGVIKTGSGSVAYDVEIPRRGMHLLQIVRDGSNGRVSRYTLPSTLVLAVTPYN